MQRRQHDAMSFHTRSSCPDERQYYCLHNLDGYSHSVLYQVVPAGKNFFHILEVPSGRIKGFRSDHNKACELAKMLEAKLHALCGGLVSSPG
ncbi:MULTISPECIES: hypothetical protein [Pseudomonas]|uniref:hypothetical protein n=1 Tax=Pseudomonas TaxID=286 RepID=UPI0018879127|nr:MULTISPECIES: hypothetical protein [Pseudomonas]QOY73879.1 hypothetical protein IH404_12745 [Pseudomonas sp. OST1909]WPN51724.1 hypothetical protein QMK52_22900 [Pseudomonas sp. P9_2]